MTKSEEFDSFELQGGKELLESQQSGSGAQSLINKDGAAAAAPAWLFTAAAAGLRGNVFGRFFILTRCLKIDGEASVSMRNAGARSNITGFFFLTVVRDTSQIRPISFHVPCRASHIHGVISACKSLRTQ